MRSQAQMEPRDPWLAPTAEEVVDALICQFSDPARALRVAEYYARPTTPQPRLTVPAVIRTRHQGRTPRPGRTARRRVAARDGPDSDDPEPGGARLAEHGRSPCR